jgi:HD superfamily phosphohydrolase
MARLNEEFNGALDTAIAIFNDHHPKKFLHQLVSSQLDMDRMDYLARDSFYSGVAEGKIGSERIIKMLAVVDNELVVEEKGIYSIEKFLMARRLMYWQVYLHRTVLCAEFMLMIALKRAKDLAQQGAEIHASPALGTFIYESLDRTRFFADEGILDQFCLLDDSDILAALKVWQFHEDFVLSEVSRRIIHRDLFRIDLRPQAFDEEEVQSLIDRTARHYGITDTEANYLVINDRIDNKLYESGGITIRFKNGTKADFADASDQLSREILMRTVAKSFVCYPKELGT